MADLISIAFTACSGILIGLLTLLYFGYQVSRRHHAIAPRCTARPKNTIYNPDPYAPKEQQRGGPTFGWIPWTLSLSFDKMLTGIPGTGTRNGGMEGAMLSVNLDAIILFRFHDLCLKVSALATVLYIVVLLPLYLTAKIGECPPDHVQSGNSLCDQDEYFWNFTNYQNITIARIPFVYEYSYTENVHELLFNDTDYEYSLMNVTGKINQSNHDANFSNLSRLYTVVFMTWIVSYYSMSLIGKEWKEVLQLRRAYYLEGDHHGNRKRELEATLHCDQNEVESSLSAEFNSTGRKGIQDQMKQRRDPWIPHPEQRETVPNIELYSVIVEHLPRLPAEMLDEEVVNNLSPRKAANWQLFTAAAFFDHCVPNQPGFSSSVAAVTILPNAPELARSWRKWYVAASALRRLRFIRAIIEDRRSYGNGCGPDDDDESNDDDRKEYDVENGLPNHPYPSDQEYVRQVFNTGKFQEEEYEFLKSQNHFPEQTAVYSREFAQSAAPCCPNGCCEDRVRNAEFQELIEMEKEAVEKVAAANKDLKDAQNVAYVIDDEEASYPSTDGDYSRAMQSMSSLHQMQGDIYSTHATSRSESSSAPNVMLNIGMKSMPSTDDEHVRELDSIAEKLPSKLQTEAELFKKFARNPTFITPTTSATNSFEASSKNPTVPTKITTKKITTQNNTNHIPSPPVKTVPRRSVTSSNVPDVDLISSPHRMKRTKSAPLSQNRIRRSVSMSLSKTGKFVLREDDSEDETSVYSASSRSLVSSVVLSRQNLDQQQNRYINDLSSAKFSITDHSHKEEEEFHKLFPLSSRRRVDSSSSHGTTRVRRNIDGPSEQWYNYERIYEEESIIASSVNRARISSRDSDVSPKDKYQGKAMKPYSGEWKLPKIGIPRFDLSFNSLFGERKVANNLIREDTVAIVTFTSRQAAVAFRHCIADGRGLGKWSVDTTLPVPPLADAASCDLITCRGCCRPVTVTVQSKEKMIRKFIAMSCLVFLYIFYIFPIYLATSLLDSRTLEDLFPFLQGTQNVIFAELSGIVSSVLLTGFFALAPQLFKAISNFGSNANSVINAERAAMRYYWWFMLITAFSSVHILNATLQIFTARDVNIDDSVTNLLQDIAKSIPNQVSATWLNWIILRTTVVLPMQYLLQINTFLFYAMGMKCCARCVMGGGPGGQTPYRIYIDSGVVFMCVVALAPASPIVAPVSFLYFLVCCPMWRRNSIYIYRPKFDGGGVRWPFLSDELISSLIFGHILMATMMILRSAYGPAIVASLPIFPIFLYRKIYRNKYFPAFSDAGLLQTANLDGWDTSEASSVEKREDFRRFLVDAHKAAYIPVCLASNADNSLTFEPAAVVPLDTDVSLDQEPQLNSGKTDQYNMEQKNTSISPIPNAPSVRYGVSSITELPSIPDSPFSQLDQYGVSLRRVTGRKFIQHQYPTNESS